MKELLLVFLGIVLAVIIKTIKKKKEGKSNGNWKSNNNTRK